MTFQLLNQLDVAKYCTNVVFLEQYFKKKYGMRQRRREIKTSTLIERNMFYLITNGNTLIIETWHIVVVIWTQLHILCRTFSTQFPCIKKNMKNAVFWDVAPCRSCVNRRFGWTYRERGTSVSRWLQMSPTPNPQSGGPPLVSCPRLLIQYIRS
jgi:hypothetical protein